VAKPNTGEIPIIIISKGRSNLITTPQSLGKFSKNVKVLVPQSELADYKANKTLNEITIIPHVETSLLPTRNRSLDYGEFGDWIILLDDNLLGWTKVVRGEEVKITGEEFICLMRDDLHTCDANDIWLYGTATNSNLMFRRSRYKTSCFVQTKCCAIKKSTYRFDERLYIREEFDMTASHLFNDGRLLRNDHLFAKRKHYMEGGIGSRKEREARYIKDAKFLMKKYPDLLKYVSKKDHAPYSEINIRITTERGIRKWRKGILRTPQGKALLESRKIPQ